MKTIQSKDNTLKSTLLELSNPRLVFITAATSLKDPSTWTEAAQYATSGRPSLSGKVPGTGSITSSGTTRVVQLPSANLDCDAIAGSGFTAIAIAVVDGIAALAATTVGRVVDITDKQYAVSDVPRFAQNSWTASED